MAFILTLMTLKERKRILEGILFKNSYAISKCLIRYVFVFFRTKPGRLTIDFVGGSGLVGVMGDP